jgi:hypothetical protein
MRPILHMAFLIISLYNFLTLLTHWFASPFLELLTCQILLFLNSLISLSSLCVMSLTFQIALWSPWSHTFVLHLSQ